MLASTPIISIKTGPNGQYAPTKKPGQASTPTQLADYLQTNSGYSPRIDESPLKTPESTNSISPNAPFRHNVGLIQEVPRINGRQLNADILAEAGL